MSRDDGITGSVKIWFHDMLQEMWHRDLNLRGNKGLDRFTLRGRCKVDGQWDFLPLR